MAKNSVSDWDTVADNNTDVANNNIAENCPPSTINNAMRAMMAQVKSWYNNVPRLDISNVFAGMLTATKMVIDSAGSTTIADRGLKLQVDGVERASLQYESDGFGFRTKTQIRMVIDGAERWRSTVQGTGFGVSTAKTSVSDTGAGTYIAYSGLMWIARDDAVAVIAKRTGTDGAVIQFGKNTAAVGSISVTASGTTYNTTSDMRLKRDFKPIDPGFIDRIKVYDFAWKSGSGRSYGVVAQELHDVYPQAVSAGERAEDMWGVDHSKLVPILIAAIQDLRSRIETIEGN